MIQDIAPHRYRNEYNPKPPEKDSIMLCYDGHQVLLEKKGEEIRFPTFAELEKENDGIYENYTYLFEIDGKCFYLGEHIRYAQLSTFQMEHTGEATLSCLCGDYRFPAV